MSRSEISQNTREFIFLFDFIYLFFWVCYSVVVRNDDMERDKARRREHGWALWTAFELIAAYSARSYHQVKVCSK